MTNSSKNILIVFLSFGIYFILDALYFKIIRNWLFELTNQYGISHIITYVISGIPLYLGTYAIINTKSIFESFGLNKSIIKGFIFSLLCTLPMFIGFSFLFDFNPHISLNTFLISIVAAGFFEELFFRGFLFGQLYKYTKLGFIPAVFFGALYFGFIHLYQSTIILELIEIFLITFLGGIIFAWVYIEWNFNLWVPIFLHLLMNLSWEMFSVSDNVLGGVYSSVFRIISIGLIIFLTILYKKKKGIPLTVNKNTILLKNITTKK